MLQGMVLLVALLVVGCATQSNETREVPVKVPWQGYHQARATGKAESKPILLNFATDWDKDSQRIKLETYSNFEVAQFLQDNFATGWVDVEEYPQLAKKYDVNSLPTIWILDSEGKSLTSVGGFLGPEKMLLVLKFIDTKAYDTMSYEEWKNRRLGE